MQTAHRKPTNHRTPFFVHIVGFLTLGTLVLLSGDIAGWVIWLIVLFLHFYIPEYQESVLRRSAATWYRILTPADIVLYIHLGCFQTVAMFVITNTISSLMGWYPVRYFSWLEIVILIPCWYAMILIHARLLPDYDPEKTRQNESD